MGSLNPFKIPAALRIKRQWVLWKMVAREDGEEKTKVPFQPNGRKAKAGDPSTWNEFASVLRCHSGGQYDGIGFEFADDGNLCGIDLDGCRDPQTGRVAEWAKSIIVDLDTYAEVSPSMSGVKLFAIARLPGGSGRKKVVDAEQIGDKQPAVELYDRGRYFAVTGLKLAGCPAEPQDRQPQIDKLVRELWPAVEAPAANFYSHDAVIDRARKYLAKVPLAISKQGGHNATFHAACILVCGFGLTESEAFAVLSEWNMGCQPPWSERDLRHKIAGAFKQPGDRGFLRNATPQSWSHIRLPKYECAAATTSGPTITTLVDATKAYVERIRSGDIKLLETGIADVDTALGGGLESGELVIVAARPSHGKSAMALQAVHTWTALNRPCLIISEEMSSLALGKRSLQFISDVPQEHWQTSLDRIDQEIASYSDEHAPAIIAESCITADSALEQIERAVEKHKIQMVAVDYAQILRGAGKNRFEQITNTSIALKQAAAKHNIVVLLLCQLKRDIEARAKFVPTMSDIKDTGQLEQDADVIMFLVWPYKIDSSKSPELFQVFVAKNRNRAIMQPAVICRFLPSRQMILPPRVQDRKNFEPVFDAWNSEKDF